MFYFAPTLVRRAPKARPDVPEETDLDPTYLEVPSMQDASLRAFQLFIDGKWVDGKNGQTSQAINPTTEEPWATVAVAELEDVDAAVAAAKRAHQAGEWRGRSRAERAEVLNNIANLVYNYADELTTAEVLDAGATMRKATTADIPGTGLTFSTLAELLVQAPEEAIHHEVTPVNSTNILRKEPLGVCVGIVPFNFPMLMAAWKIGPAIAAGNTVVLKPSPHTASTALILARICQEAGVPDGVVNVVTGPGVELGEALVRHPDVAKVSFTGSTKVGKRIMELASGTLKRITLELGGKSPNIILHDADLECAVRGSLFSTFFHSGQICESGTRLLVPHSLHDEFVDRMIAVAKEIQLGDPMDPMTTMGPLISAAQRDNVERFVYSGKQDGATCVIGGKRPAGFDRGYYYEPTLFTGVRNDMKIAREEIFGPVISIIPYRDEQEAIRIANDSLYGLGGAIWSKDTDRAVQMARQIETGTIWINDYHLVNLRFPFGGYKQSGIGREMGPQGLEEYEQIKHIHVGEPDLSGKYYFNWLLNPAEE